MSQSSRLKETLARVAQGGSPKYHQKNAEQGKLFARERIARLVDAGSFVEDAMTKATESQFVESTAGQVAAELARRGIAPDQHVTVVVEPDDWIAEARRFSREKVIEAGWLDDDIDRIIKQAQQEVKHLLPE